jgi:uncharacterized protein (TIGR02301 family)
VTPRRRFAEAPRFCYALVMLIRALVLTATLALAAFPVAAEEKTPPADEKAAPPQAIEKPTPYDGKLLRLAEILGSIHYLRNLCKGDEGEWRQIMEELLADETAGEPQRAARLTAAFNRGFRTFAATYVKCTPQAIAAEEAYRAEGATLATEITARFGN